jgi:hypothetical protein
LCTEVATNELAKEMDRYKVDIRTLQEIRWPEKGTVIKKNYVSLYSGHKSDNHEFGTRFYISIHIMDNLLDFESANERNCKIRVKLTYYILTLLSIRTPTKEKDEVANYDLKQY